MNSKTNKMPNKIYLPALRGAIGDWFYYVTILSFKEIAARVRLPKEIDAYNEEEKKLGEWIQRELDPQRTKSIVEYLNSQEQRFFNSLIIGIYGGQPSWQELSISMNVEEEAIPEEAMDYMERTFGILTLNGEESVFAIDGQHRAIGIREAVAQNTELLDDEVSVVFVAHKTDEIGVLRTRRLFSTLNRYAKPVNKTEIIILSEDDNCAIITRNLIEKYSKFNNKILLHKTRVISTDDKVHFSNVMVLYDIVETLLTDKKVFGLKVSGRDRRKFTNKRLKDETEIIELQDYIQNLFDRLINEIPSLTSFFGGNQINRKDADTSLLFRPIGQNILFSVMKVANENNLLDSAIEYFGKDDFNLSHDTWKKIFWNDETETLSTDKTNQRFATKLILDKLGINVNRTQKDNEVLANYNLTINDI